MSTITEAKMVKDSYRPPIIVSIPNLLFFQSTNEPNVLSSTSILNIRSFIVALSFQGIPDPIAAATGLSATWTSGDRLTVFAFSQNSTKSKSILSNTTKLFSVCHYSF